MMIEDTEFEDTGHLLATTLTTDLPSDVESRLRSRLEELKKKIESTSLADVVPDTKQRRWSMRPKVLTAISAAILLCAVVLFPFGSSQALAQIAKAIAATKWLHASGTVPASECHPLHGRPSQRCNTTRYSCPALQQMSRALRLPCPCPALPCPANPAPE